MPIRANLRAAGVGALDRRPAFVRRICTFPEDPAPDEDRRLLRRAAALAVRPRLEPRRAGRVPALHHSARRQGRHVDAGATDERSTEAGAQARQGRRSARCHLLDPRESAQAGGALGLAFGDGKVAQGGSPPATVTHTTPKDGVYTATLIVYLEPPFTAAAIRYVTKARVKVGKKADEPLRLVATPRPARRRSRSASARPSPRPGQLGLRPGDGTESIRPGQAAAVPRQHLHDAGDYRAVLIVHLASNERLLAYIDVEVR